MIPWQESSDVNASEPRRTKPIIGARACLCRVTNVAERLVQHKHCPVCGRAMSADKKTCSDDCEVRHEAIIREKKRTMYMFYAVAIFIVVLLAVQFM